MCGLRLHQKISRSSNWSYMIIMQTRWHFLFLIQKHAIDGISFFIQIQSKLHFFIFKETNQRWHFRQQSLILYSHRQTNGSILTGQSLDNNAKKHIIWSFSYSLKMYFIQTRTIAFMFDINLYKGYILIRRLIDCIIVLKFFDIIHTVLSKCCAIFKY